MQGLWPAAILFAFCVQAITGFFLWAYYSPSAQTAWESVYFLQYEVAGGWLLRAIHHYSAHVLLAMLIAVRRAEHSHRRVSRAARVGVLGHRGTGARARWRPC